MYKKIKKATRLHNLYTFFSKLLVRFRGRQISELKHFYFCSGSGCMCVSSCVSIAPTSQENPSACVNASTKLFIQKLQCHNCRLPFISMFRNEANDEKIRDSLFSLANSLDPIFCLLSGVLTAHLPSCEEMMPTILFRIGIGS